MYSAGDKNIYELKEGTVCEEFVCVQCPKCGQITEQVNTTLDRTHYGHWNYKLKFMQWCVVERGNDFIDDALLFVQRVQGDNDYVDVSCTVEVW